MGIRIPTLYMVIPCYNEEDALLITGPVFIGKLKGLIDRGMVSDYSRIVFVDDGSRDKTAVTLKEFTRASGLCDVVTLAENCGHQIALMNGIRYSRGRCDALITLDADGQNDLSAIDEMLDKYQDGYEIVYGVRSSRDTDGVFKRVTAGCYYALMKLMGKPMLKNHADYRLITAPVIDRLCRLGSEELLLRGVLPTMGFKEATVEYTCNERVAGTTKYTMRKMMHLAGLGLKKAPKE